MKILLTNAPPSAGKDTLAQYLLPNPQLFPEYDLHFERFSRPHKEAFAAMTAAKIDPFYNVEGYEDTKGDVIPWLGVSYRQWQIDFSEKFMKPLYGDDIFTRMFYARIRAIEETMVRNGNRDEKQAQSLFIVADCGFDVELKALLNYGVPADDILLMRVHRPGCTYKGDSRSFIHNEDVLSCDIHNDSTKAVYWQRAVAATHMWLRGEAHMFKDIYDKKED
jgi:hypothetical protein